MTMDQLYDVIIGLEKKNPEAVFIALQQSQHEESSP